LVNVAFVLANLVAQRGCSGRRSMATLGPRRRLVRRVGRFRAVGLNFSRRSVLSKPALASAVGCRAEVRNGSFCYISGPSFDVRKGRGTGH
jgi:hypothetical protein